MKKLSKLIRIIIPLVIFISLVAATGGPGNISLAKAHPLLIKLSREEPEKPVAVIVQKLVNDNHLESRVEQFGGEVTKRLTIINAFAARLAASKAVELSMDPGVRWVSLDAPVVEMSGVEETNTVQLRADFNQPSFTQSASNWNQAWLEIGETDGAEAGDVLITSFLSGSAQGVRLQGAQKGIQSTVSLVQTKQATLSIGFRRKVFESAQDYVSLQLSLDGGTQWVDLDRLSGPASDSELNTVQYDLSPYLPADLTLRFIGADSLSSSARFYLDYVQVEYLADPKPQTEFAYSVMLPMVANYNLESSFETDPYAVQAVEFNYSKTVRDEFSSVTFNANNGNITWVGEWTENDVEGSGPASGGVSIANGELQLMDQPDTGTEPSLARRVDLSRAASAIFSFDYHTSAGVDAEDAIVAEVSKDGGVTYTPVRIYTGISGQTWGTARFDISSFMSASTHIRFRVLGAYSEQDENFLIDNVQVAYAPRLAETVRDEFTQIAYQNNSGIKTWSSDWIEYDPDGGGGATGGYIRINQGGKLTFHYLWYEHIKRSANLLGSSQAFLSFDWQTVGLDPGDKLSVQVSPDGISPFVEIGTLEGNQSGFFYYNISSYISQNTTIRLGNFGQYMDYGEYIYIDNLQIAFESDCPDCISTVDLQSNFAKSIGADVLWNESNYLQGQGVTVAVVDSGIAPHADFLGADGQSRILAQVEFVTEGSSADDFYGHGTHVAGTIGGNGYLSEGRYPGVAPQVNLVDVKVMDDLGIGTTSDVIAGLQWIFENKDVYNIRIVNLSLNSTVAESYHVNPLDAALEVLWFNGMVVVVSAGNNGTYASGVVFPPANDPFVITVGAVDDMGTQNISDDLLASFSAFGTTDDGFSKPDIVVPGRNIISPLASDDCNLIIEHPSNAVLSEDGVFYFRMSGTSMASGVAAGAVALLLQDEPSLSPDQVKHRLLSTASPYQAGNGADYMDIYQAVHATSLENANTDINASQLLWTGAEPVVWGSVAWNSVAWNSVAWNSVAWNSVAWNSVAWNSTYWEP